MIIDRGSAYLEVFQMENIRQTLNQTRTLPFAACSFYLCITRAFFFSATGNPQREIKNQPHIHDKNNLAAHKNKVQNKRDRHQPLTRTDITPSQLPELVAGPDYTASDDLQPIPVTRRGREEIGTDRCSFASTVAQVNPTAPVHVNRIRTRS